MFLLVSNFKMIGMRAIERCARSGPKKLQKPRTKESNEFPNHSTLITMVTLNKFKNWKLTLSEDEHQRLCEVVLKYAWIFVLFCGILKANRKNKV